DSQVGILRVWNVSHPSPLENLKLKKTGFHTLGVFLSPPRNKREISFISLCGNRYTSSSKSHAVRLAQGHAICCFKDAGVGLYDLGTRKWDFFQDTGHVETIFDCEFKPDNPNLLATASFDGTIKVWDINDMAATAMSPGNEGVIYSLSWAPGDLNCIAGSTSCNGAFIWDINKGTIRIRFNEHGKNRIFSIAWNKSDPKRIATGSADGFCIIHSIEGKVLQRYRHPAAVYGCDWSHTSSNMIATGCEDGNVRVYYLAAGSDQPLKVFKGHTAKVFNVRWSPLREGIFCSGSDDNTVRIWDYTKDACIITLCGHTGPVRGLVWNTEVPYLLVSGSWDYSIRIWDTRSGVCLDIVQVHGADVYGVTCHPRRPFTMASCSRDSTVRLWTLTPLVAPLTLGLLAQRPWEEIIGRLDEAMAPCSPPLLCGNISKDIKQEIEKHGEDVQAKKLCLFSEFFFPLGGSKNLCDLVAVLRDQEESLLPHDYSRGIVHTRHMVKIKMSEAQRLTSTKMHKLGCSIGAPSKQDQLRAAAAIHLRLGQLQRYCELMVELGEVRRRATQLLDEGSNEAIPYCIATGDLTSIVEFFSARGQLADALLVTQATCEGNVQAPIHNHSGSTPPGRPSLGKDNAKLLVQVSTDMAECYLQDGQAIVSACCRLAVDDIEMAMVTLVRGNELELAVMVGLVLGDQAAPLTHYSLQLLARRAQALGHWYDCRYLAVDLLKQMPKNDMAMVKLCASTQLCNEELDVLHQKCNLPSLEECALLAQSLHEQGDVLQTVRYTLLSPAPETALEMGLAFVKDVMSRKDWKLQEVLSVLDMLGSIRTKVLQKNELLILCGYAGAMLAIRRHYITIVAALYEYTSQLLRWRDVTVPLVVEELALELDAWQSCQGEDLQCTCSDAQLVLYETLMERVGHEPIRSMVGQDYITASHLPSHSEVYTSCLNGAMIQGPAVLLEDGKSAIPLNDALMWSKVNPFSPLGTGLHLLPL
uniref:WD repeat domain 17 n=1 Tax=Eptatretus burgeri TaxID=7764 RepID=A0A8C4RB88_EPTBU